MKKIICLLGVLICFSALTMGVAQAYGSDAVPRLIPLNEQSFTDENIYKYHDIDKINKMSVLGNEQDKLPLYPQDALPPPSSMNTDQPWKPNFAAVMQGSSGFIDLKDYYFITKIVLLDVNANPELSIFTGKPFDWTLLTTIALNTYKTWRTVDIDFVSTRYLRLTCPENVAGFTEIGLYGYRDDSKSDKEYRQPSRQRPVTTADKAFGVNAFVDDPIQVSRVAGHIREFHNITFTTSDKNYFSPSANSAWDFDAYYKELYEKGIDVIPCIQGTNTAISGENIIDYTGNEKPIPEGADPDLPSSYALHSSVLFNYAARYGKTRVEASRLNLGANQKAKSGLGYITYYENFNEPNKDWEGEKSYLTPYQMAAMCSADYDGHEKRIGLNYGIKNSDPNAKLVMGGLVGRNVIEYINLMKIWFENNRSDKRFVVDVINLHYYVKTAVVENTSMSEDLKKIREWVDENLPGVEIWVTEFGPEISTDEIADRFSPEYYKAKAFSTVRMFLTGYAAGMDRMTMFMLRDTESGVYSTDGLTTQKGLWETKPSWHYMYGARGALKDTVFDKTLSSEKDGVYIYRFSGKQKQVYAVFTAGRSGEKQSVTLSVPNKKSALITKLSDIYAEGLTQAAPISNGTITLTADNSPQFVSVFDIENAPIMPTKQLIAVDSISGKAQTLKKIQVLFDQQEGVPLTPTSKPRQTLVNYEQEDDYIATQPGLPENKKFPISAILDLGADYYVTDVGYYDSFSSGDIVVSAMSPSGQWVKINQYGLTMFNQWRMSESERLIASRYVKIERYSDATCFEMALYGYRALKSK